MAKTIAICNQKGGVGKTTTTLNLGVGLARQGKRVLLVDADPQSDLTASLGWNGDALENSLGRLMYLATQEYRPAVRDSRAPWIIVAIVCDTDTCMPLVEAGLNELLTIVVMVGGTI